MHLTAVHFSSAGGQQIPCHGEAQVETKIRQLRRTFKRNIVIANVINLLLRKDFLSNYGLLVNCTNNRLIDTSTNKTIKTGRINCFVEQICINNVLQLPDPIKNLLLEYPSLTAPRSNNYTSLNSIVKRTIDSGNNPPTFAKVRQLSQEKYEAAKEEFTSLLNARIIRQSKSPWASPLHLVPKNTLGKWRTCGDYRSVNAIVEKRKISNFVLARYLIQH